MNEEIEWDHMTEVDVVEGPVKKVTREKMIKTIKKMKPRKEAELSEVNMEMLSASGETEIKVMMALCQRVLDVRGMQSIGR